MLAYGGKKSEGIWKDVFGLIDFVKRHVAHFITCKGLCPLIKCVTWKR